MSYLSTRGIPRAAAATFCRCDFTTAVHNNIVRHGAPVFLKVVLAYICHICHTESVFSLFCSSSEEEHKTKRLRCIVLELEWEFSGGDSIFVRCYRQFTSRMEYL